VREISHVSEEDGELDEVARRAAHRAQGCTQVSEDLLSLRCKVIFPNQRAVAIKSGLAGDEDDAAGPHVHDLRIAGRGAKLWGIEAPNRLCLAISHNHPLGVGQSQYV